ncbi:MAG: glycosyl hydrolase family 28-related protein [Verrucomicrobiia bacterium]
MNRHPYLDQRPPQSVFDRFVGLATLALLLLVGLTSASAEPEEFVGPFPSWRDVQRDYGARGDGRADDTAAIQRGLDDLTHHTESCVLYIPAGTYRITTTLKTVRKAHTDCQGVAIIGEDPARTVLEWDGPRGGTMVQWDAWYSKISRLTLEGSGRAGTGLLYGPAFSTYNETSDLSFRDMQNGLVFGETQTAGQAENAVLRCRFLGCETGIQTVNWNSMDIWVWYCWFEDCGRGVHNVMGNWHVWHSVFLRSRTADLSSINLMAFSAVNNVSFGSRRFFDFSTGHTWGSPVSLTGNRVIDPTGDWAVILDNAGPYLVVDNKFRLKDSTRAVRMTWADQTLVGNVYSRADAVEERGRYRRLDERTAAPEQISDELPPPPATPHRHDRRVFEVPAGADAAVIQVAIDQASTLLVQRPVVHLPMGSYPIQKTLSIPGGSDLQIVGDSAGETGTRLNWTGPSDGVVVAINGPTHAVLRDFFIHAGEARALVVTECDQDGGRIFADQLNANGPTATGGTNAAAIRVTGLRRTDVLLRCLQGSGNKGRWLEVVGGGEVEPPANQVSVFTGATGSASGQYEVRQGGRLVVRGVYHERSSDSLNGLHLADSGVLSIDATRFSYATSVTAPTVAVDNFRGLFTLATCMLLPVETRETCRFELRGDGSDASVLVLNSQFWVEQKTVADDVWRNIAQPRARGGLLGCNINSSMKDAVPKGFEFLADIGEQPDPAKSASGAGPLDNRGVVDDETLLRHLDPLRAARVWLPDDSAPRTDTDLQIHRVMADGGQGAVVEFRAGR